jgi:hypothetical protein
MHVSPDTLLCMHSTREGCDPGVEDPFNVNRLAPHDLRSSFSPRLYSLAYLQ